MKAIVAMIAPAVIAAALMYCAVSGLVLGWAVASSAACWAYRKLRGGA